MVLIPNRNENYPLHLAIKNQQTCDTAHNLFQAFPGAGMKLDTKTKLIPFMLAAVGDWNRHGNQMTAIYQLLREDPHSLCYV